MHEAHQRGFNVSKDLSFGSFYDGPVAELLNPAVTPGVRLLVVLSDSYRRGPGAVKSG